MSVFKKIYIVGSGSICINVIKSLIEKGEKPICLLYKEHPISSLSLMLKNKSIEHFVFEDKNNLKEFLENISDNTLILSVNNTYLFPKSVVQKENIKIINFHNALLPYHRGINAPVWSIYEQDKFAGITWHVVNENIDDGDIIIQKKIKLNNTETAIYLIRQLMNLAFSAYKEIENDILNWTITTTPMPKTNTMQIHYSKDIPNNGIYDETWDNSKKSAFLRALDWGCINQFEKPKLIKNKKEFIITGYEITNSESGNIEINLTLDKKCTGGGKAKGLTSLLNIINNIRNTNINTFETNYFNFPVDSDCICYFNNGAIVFLNREKDFYKLYYAFCDLTDFEKLLRMLPKLNIYLEILSKNNLSKKFLSIIEKHFSYCTTYQKLYKKLKLTAFGVLPESTVDVDLLYKKIYSSFNIYFEHLMEKDELERLAQEGKVLTIYENGELKSFLIYKVTGKKAYLNFIANYGTKENLISLWKLFYEVLNYNKIGYLDLWYDINNKKAENMYNIEQFQPLKMYNFVYKIKS